MDQIYHIVGIVITWTTIGLSGLFLTVFLPMLFWSFNDRHYTWLYQLVEVIKVYFKYRNKVFKDKQLLLSARSHVNERYRIFKSWHLRFIDRKIKEYDRTISVKV